MKWFTEFILSKIKPISFFFIITWVLSPAESQAQNEDRPNILWIVSEDNGASYLGAYGNAMASTPNLDRLARRSVVYDNAFAPTPVCAPTRFTLITGTYSNAMGAENMRSSNSIPDFIHFFPKYLQKAGYYTTNNAKKDYNTIDQPEAWDESSQEATYKNRRPGQPFFHVKNLHETHESRIHGDYDVPDHDPEQVPVPPYMPSTEPVKRDIARYYDQVSAMDARVGQILKELKDSGEAENTIIFYYSDHGGVLPRSKRFMFESGLHIPLMVYFPPKYSDLKPLNKRTDQLVSFVDFVPTVLSLAGIDPPEYMQGNAFLGRYADSPHDYVYMNRGRMDERYDLIRAVRDKQFLYVHNYMPQRIYGQHLWYLWKAGSMQSWEKHYREGNLNAIQKNFFQPKPAEELYNVSNDPDNIHNLADNPAYQHTLERMRKANVERMKSLPDLGFIPESMIDDISNGKSLYQTVCDKEIPMDRIIETAEMASMAREADLDKLMPRLNDVNAIVRYWAAMGFAIAGERAKAYQGKLLEHTEDAAPEVKLAIGEALFNIGRKEKGMDVIESVLGQPDLFLNLSVLNVLESLHPTTLPPKVLQKVQTLNRQYNVDSEPGQYIYRASTSLLKDYTTNQ